MGCTRRGCAAPESTSTRGCWRILTACGKGAVGCTRRACCPTAHAHTRGLILSASDGIRNMFSTHSHTSHLLHCCFHCGLRLGNCLLCHGSGEVIVVTLFLNSLTMCAAVSEEAASDILVGAQPRIRCWTSCAIFEQRIGRHSHSTTASASGRCRACGTAVPISLRMARPRSTQRRHEVA